MSGEEHEVRTLRQFTTQFPTSLPPTPPSYTIHDTLISHMFDLNLIHQANKTPCEQGASIEEQLIEACRRDNVELLTELLEDKEDSEITRLLNQTTTVMGNHLYHEAASRGNCAFSSPPSKTALLSPFLPPPF